MDLEQARRVLGILAEDDMASVKRKYRRLIGAFHPDAVGSDRPEHIRQAQEINAAYNLLKKHNRLHAPKRTEKAWQSEVNEKAFSVRNIYLYYSMDVPEKQPYYKTASGKYMWNPDEEDFDLFLTSIHHASRELLEKTEDAASFRMFHSGLSEEAKFVFQAQIFQYLAMQYIDPVKTLKKIAEPVKTDRQGREIYCFRAFLGAQQGDESWNVVALLENGDALYPKSFQGNKIAVMNAKEQRLGYLSLEDDQLYFCIIPLLKKRLAQIKMTVKEVEIKRKARPRRAKANVAFYFRLEVGADKYEESSLNLKIADILGQYEKLLRESS